MWALPYVLLAKVHQAAIDARRRDRTWRYLAWSLATSLTASLMILIGALFAALLWSVELWWLALILGGVLVVPLAAVPAARHVLVPLGCVRLAYYAGYVSRAGRDAEAYGLCLAAWAFAHRPKPAGEAWLAAHRDARVPLGDAEVAVTALMVAGRGDADAARELFASVALLVEDHPAVREVAGEWLAVDAAERGAWAELHEAAAAARWPATPLTYFLEGVAARRCGATGAPSPRELRARWWLARTAARPRAARRSAPDPAAAPAGADRRHPGRRDAGRRAGRRRRVPGARRPARAGAAAARDRRAPRVHRARRRRDRRRPRRHRPRVGRRARRRRDPPWLARRALELEAPLGAVDRALRDVAGTVTDELARTADAARLGAPASHGPVGDALARRLRHGRLDALETGFARWSRRRKDDAQRSSIDEWREFLALRHAYAAAVAAGGPELRRLAFPHAWSTGNSMAVWLWNTRSEYALSHAISRWLLDEALAVGDAEAIELGHKNCRLTVPTRLGDVVHPAPDE